MSIKAIFYSRFDTAKGPRVIHQVPEGSVIPNEEDEIEEDCLFAFDAVSSFIIPRQSLCGNLISLVPPSIRSPKSKHSSSRSYRILGFPICLDSESYSRNEFIFNFCLVLSANDPDFNAYKSVVTKLAHLMRSLEEQSQFLSDDDSPPNTGKVYSLCETLISDLNNYCECMIPIDELNTLNLKIFPTYPPPPPVKPWHVPIFTVRPETLMDENWDLTMQIVVPHINGIRSVKHIAFLSDADVDLTCQCIKHLIYYGCVLLLDMFSFSAIYAPTAEFSATIGGDEEMQRECARYVNLAFAPSGNSDDNLTTAIDNSLENPIAGDDIWPQTSSGKLVDGAGIVEMFASLRQGQSVREWYSENGDMLANIDLRRFITFGVIKGFLYRVHKYPYAVVRQESRSRSVTVAAAERDRKLRARNLESRDQGLLTSKDRDRDRLQPRALDAFNLRRVAVEDIHHFESEDDASTITSRSGRTDGQYQHRKTDRLSHHHHHHHRSNRRRYNSRGRFLSDLDNSDSDSMEPLRRRDGDGNGDGDSELVKIAKYLDGTHCFDEICTNLELGEGELAERLRRWNSLVPGGGDVLIIHR